MTIEQSKAAADTEKLPQLWQNRDNLYRIFYSKAYAGCFDSTILEIFLDSARSDTPMTAAERAPYRAQMEASGLTEAEVHNRMIALLEPLTESDKEVIISCIGLARHHLPTLEEAAEGLGYAPMELDACVEALANHYCADEA